ncbi:hypothetical protein FF38_07252 [Lucilia cuprina]|uniref:Uncharacterized protein n=1 Tax=Lucilia cuprina TaxID=7375 RepID=A0A0L0BLZ9_LUCCU|nr:hypothetical protein FF38_07252 [Lucilia cuprina]
MFCIENQDYLRYGDIITTSDDESILNDATEEDMVTVWSVCSLRRKLVGMTPMGSYRYIRRRPKYRQYIAQLCVTWTVEASDIFRVSQEDGSASPPREEEAHDPLLHTDGNISLGSLEGAFHQAMAQSNETPNVPTTTTTSSGDNGRNRCRSRKTEKCMFLTGREGEFVSNTCLGDWECYRPFSTGKKGGLTPPPFFPCLTWQWITTIKGVRITSANFNKTVT